MFEQTFVSTATEDRKPYTVLLSLLMQIATLCALVLIPLIYTQVLPQAHLRSVFAAPAPPPPALPKAPEITRTAVTRNVFRPIFLPVISVPAPRPSQPVIDTAPVIPSGVADGVEFSTGPILDALPAKPPEPPKPPVSKPATPQRIRVTTLDPSQLLYKVQPVYPAMARSIRVQGTVEFTAVISKTGTIENLQLVNGHPLLVLAAKEAILQWRYKPTVLNGEPVEVITNIVVNFTLNQN